MYVEKHTHLFLLRKVSQIMTTLKMYLTYLVISHEVNAK